MKKFLFLIVLVAGGRLCFGQSGDLVIEGSSKINRHLTPQQVIDSLNKTFPDAKSVRYFKTPPDAARRGWTVKEENNLSPGETIDYYTISFKRANMKYYGLYTRDGRLVNS